MEDAVELAMGFDYYLTLTGALPPGLCDRDLIRTSLRNLLISAVDSSS